MLPVSIAFSLFCVLFSATTALYSQSKKELEATVSDQNDQIRQLEAERDSLEMLADTLQFENEFLRDSLQGDLDAYKSFFTYIRDQFFPENAKNLDLKEAIALVDSLSASRDSTVFDLRYSAVVLADSLDRMSATVDSLKIVNNAFRSVLDLLTSDKRYPRDPSGFQGEWKLFLTPVTLVGATPQAGLVSLNQVFMPDSLYPMMLERIVFLEDELADLYFSDGQRTKCFFKISNFDPGGTYTIDLDRSDQIDIQIFVTHVPRGLQVSYEIPASVEEAEQRFYFGYMRQ